MLELPPINKESKQLELVNEVNRYIQEYNLIAENGEIKLANLPDDLKPRILEIYKEIDLKNRPENLYLSSFEFQTISESYQKLTKYLSCEYKLAGGVRNRIMFPEFYVYKNNILNDGDIEVVPNTSFESEILPSITNDFWVSYIGLPESAGTQKYLFD